MDVLQLKFVLTVVLLSFVTGCTTGQLYYTDNAGIRKLGCDVEFTGAPSVDKFAVEYALSFCAKNFAAKGYSVDLEKAYLLNIDTTLPVAPCNSQWTHELAKSRYQQSLLSTKEYGYLVAHIDMGLAVVNQCSDSSL